MSRTTQSALFFFALLLSLSAKLPAADKPNVLFLFADDMRADTIAAHGNPHIKTPNIDKLAASGFSFRGNYVFGGNSGAVCVPSRAMLMSGKTWLHVDTATLKDAKLLPELLRENGYVTFGTGPGGSAPSNLEVTRVVPLFRSLWRNSADGVSLSARTQLLRRSGMSGSSRRPTRPLERRVRHTEVV